MIVVAMRNSDTRINSRFFDRALTIKDVYAFLQTHVVAIQKLDKKEWNKTQRIDDAGTGRIVPSKEPIKEDCGLFIQPKGEHCDVFGKQLVNRLLLNDLLTGNLGWKDAEMKPLDSSEANRKVDLSAFASRHAGRCTYDPELFSAATNGKVNIVGGKSEQQVLDGFERMRPLFDEFNPAVVVSAPEPIQSSPTETSTPFADIEPEFEFDPATFDFGEDPEPPLFVVDDEQEARLPQDNFYEPLAIFSRSYQFHDTYADFTASLEPCPDNFSPYTFY
ncbi:hypothetical protein QR680_019171 [Steinernema hermaphroditum]|uniref:Uncharacterized protein n=1 Tax=Steinernema hermaphroditum TaxID=289476 RepID=A0AA39LRY9_9BILA|nr:hypothetical protein QR680_019171 [Steinernema hermaphroditum]